MNKIKNISLLAIALLLGIIKFTNINPNIINDDYDELQLVSYIAGNLFDNELKVSNEKINVIDYKIIDNSLYIYPINNNVSLPFNGIITKKSNNHIRISNHNDTYNIYLDKSNYYLYQYYNQGLSLGRCSNYFIVRCDDYTSITSHLIHNYEKV